jgi:hypothetical protein
VPRARVDRREFVFRGETTEAFISGRLQAAGATRRATVGCLGVFSCFLRLQRTDPVEGTAKLLGAAVVGSWQWAEESQHAIWKQVDVIGDRLHPLASIWRTEYCQTHRLSLVV